MSPLCSLIMVNTFEIATVVRIIKVKLLTLESLWDTICHKCAGEETPLIPKEFNQGYVSQC